MAQETNFLISFKTENFRNIFLSECELSSSIDEYPPTQLILMNQIFKKTSNKHKSSNNCVTKVEVMLV